MVGEKKLEKLLTLLVALQAVNGKTFAAVVSKSERHDAMSSYRRKGIGAGRMLVPSPTFKQQHVARFGLAHYR